MKIKSIMFANAVKIGATQVDFASSDKYDIVIKDTFCVRIEEKDDGRKKSALGVAYTTLFNVKWWHPDETVSADVAEKMKAEAEYIRRTMAKPQESGKRPLDQISKAQATRPTE